MTLRKVGDNPDWMTERQSECRSPSHDPPSMIVLENGLWEHTCPDCGKKTAFRVNRPTL